MRYSQTRAQELTANGRLQIDTFALDIARPVDNAIVRVMPRNDRDNILEELRTNSSGQTPIIDLPAPPLDFSMQPFSDYQPYSEYDVSVDMEGYEKFYVEGVQILPDTISYQDTPLSPLGAYNRNQTEIVEIKEHTLWGDFPEKIPEDEVKPLPEHHGFIVLPEPVIPEFIIVHMGVPTNKSAKRHWVPFKDYIKNETFTKHRTAQKLVLARFSCTKTTRPINMH
ncbi:MAG: hypothetical protein FWE91_04540 [Defluviitaleaceae bacterium]|nr:hypothetical protein [Defluviitaleaceae bacterium]